MSDPIDPATNEAEFRSWPRFLARCSIFAGMACCTMNCVLYQLTAKQPGGPSSLANILVSSASLLLVLAGFIAGLIAFFRGLKQQSRDTTIIATIGLTLCGGILFLMVWFLLLLQNAKTNPAQHPEVQSSEPSSNKAE